jgi:hypothetical protein
MDRTLYIFIDESGNFDFSPKGTKYFTLTAFATFDPVISRERLLRLKYNLLAQGTDQEMFHATEDRQVVRDEVYKILLGLKDTSEVHSVIVRKENVHPSLYVERYKKKGREIVLITGLPLYQKTCYALLHDIFKDKNTKTENVVVVLGSLFFGERRKIVLRTLKAYLKENFSGARFETYCHQSRSDINCQLADYCSWAVSIKRERGEVRPYEIIAPMIKSEFEMFP